MPTPIELATMDFWSASRVFRGTAPDADTVELAILALIRLSAGEERINERRSGASSRIAARSAVILRQWGLLQMPEKGEASEVCPQIGAGS